MPVMEPMMSTAYALSGGIDLSSGPRGIASAAITAVTRATARMRIVGLVSALCSARPKNSSSWDLMSTLSWFWVTMVTTTSSSSGKAMSDQRAPLRPSRMPRPMPRKLAISRKLLKNPM